MKLNEKDYDLLLPILSKVLDVISNLKAGKEMDKEHRYSEIKEVLRKATEDLKDPDIVANQKIKKEDMKFYESVDLKSLVQWRI